LSGTARRRGEGNSRYVSHQRPSKLSADERAFLDRIGSLNEEETEKLTVEEMTTQLRTLGRLSLYNKSFRITKLDAQSVLAEPNSSDLCIRQTLTFDRIAKAVTFVRTKINREDDECSIVQDEPVTLFLGEPL
jgi:hypothetical protein